MTRLIRRLFLFTALAGVFVAGVACVSADAPKRVSDLPEIRTAPEITPGRMVQLGPIIHVRAPRQGCLGGVLDLRVNKLSERNPEFAGLAQSIQRPRTGDNRRSFARIQPREGPGQRPQIDREAGRAVPGRTRQRLSHLARLPEPLLAHTLPSRQTRYDTFLAHRGRWVHGDRGGHQQALR